MTDRYNALVVVLDQDIRSDDAETIINAIKALKHVVSVKGNVSDINSHTAEAIAKHKLQHKIFEVLL